MITVGQITKPQGVRGEVKVRPLTDDPSRFCVLKSVTVGGRLFKIEKARCSGGDVFLKLAGVNDRNDAELLRGEFISINRAAAVALDDGEYFIADLIDSRLCAKGDDNAFEQIGYIRAIQSFGAADVFSVDLDNGKKMTFAFVKSLAAEFDAESRTLYVDGLKLREVAVYDED